MIECTNCGAQGEANFSTNFFGELVCELCGTQSFLQSRNETQDMEDTNLDMSKAATFRGGRKRRTKRDPNARLRRRQADGDNADEAPWVGRRGRPHRPAGARARKRSRVALLDCLRATQTILGHQAQALIQLGGFPDEYADVVQEIWFLFLETWELKSSKPLLRCFTEFFIAQNEEDRAMDPALTQQLLEQWDAQRDEDEAPAAQQAAAIAEARAADVDSDAGELDEDEDNDHLDTSRPRGKKRKAKSDGDNKKTEARRGPKSNDTIRLRHYSETLDRFSIMDLLGMLALAARVLNLGVTPSDVAHWVATGQLPFHNLLSVCATELQDAVSDVSLFFESTILNHRVCASRVAYHAHYIQHHIELKLPPLNVSLVAYTMCANLGFPPQVFRHFQWIVAHFNTKGALLDKPLLRMKTNAKLLFGELESNAGIAAHLAVAVRMCANWHEWIYERVLRRVYHVPAYRIQDARGIPRRELDDFVEFCESALVGVDRANIPPVFESHVYDLRGKYGELSQKQQHQHQQSGASSSQPNGAGTGDADGEDAGRLVEHALRAYPALYVNGVCDERDEEIEERVAFIKQMLREQNASGNGNGGDEDSDKDDDVFFYPFYTGKNNVTRVLHAAYETVLEALCEYADLPIGNVLPIITRLDMQVKAECKALEQRVFVTRPPAKRAGAESPEL